MEEVPQDPHPPHEGEHEDLERDHHGGDEGEEQDRGPGPARAYEGPRAHRRKEHDDHEREGRDQDAVDEGVGVMDRAVVEDEPYIGEELAPGGQGLSR